MSPRRYRYEWHGYALQNYNYIAIADRSSVVATTAAELRLHRYGSIATRTTAGTLTTNTTP